MLPRRTIRHKYEADRTPALALGKHLFLSVNGKHEINSETTTQWRGLRLRYTGTENCGLVLGLSLSLSRSRPEVKIIAS